MDLTWCVGTWMHNSQISYFGFLNTKHASDSMCSAVAWDPKS